MSASAAIRPTTDEDIDRLRIRDVVEAWVILRDSGDWERFATLWTDDGWMTATWFQGTAPDFIEQSRRGAEAGVRIAHVLGAHTAELAGDRAIAQTRMEIHQRGELHGEVVDVTCYGRYYDFFDARSGRWAIRRRQPIYEWDELRPVDPAVRLDLDHAELERLPDGYRFLAYLQERTGEQVRLDLPGRAGPQLESLYAEGRAWLGGAASPWTDDDASTWLDPGTSSPHGSATAS